MPPAHLPRARLLSFGEMRGTKHQLRFPKVQERGFLEHLLPATDSFLQNREELEEEGEGGKGEEQA